MNAYFDLGHYSRQVSTHSPEAQLWFDRGLIWCYGYNHEESVRCFQRASEYDPSCAMAYWGIAYASGCNYNKAWESFREDELVGALTTARAALKNALRYCAGATPLEQALIRALESRYPDKEPSSEAFSAWNTAYAAAMREVYQHFSEDIDIATLFAEALINRTPWKLWNLKTGLPAEGADTLEAVTVLEKALKQAETHRLEPHPGLLHMYIHVMEMSPHPEKALRASDALRELVPDAGHLVHMPSHIDILCGHYYNAVVANDRAIIADTKYLQQEGPLNFYTLYRSHNYHFKIYASMFLGQYKAAIEAANAMIITIPEALLREENPPMADWAEGFISMKQHVNIRFGKWQDIIDEPLPTDSQLYCVTTAMLHYAKSVAHAATGNILLAEEHKYLFEEAYARVPETRYIFNNKCTDILAIAFEMLKGELEYRKGNYEQAFGHLRKSVELDDRLPYDEPWGWMQPARHALGALLLQQGHIAKAESVYKDDLGLNTTLSRASQHPDNVWSLHGLVECLERQGKHQEATAARARLDLAKARADVSIEASCYCRLEKAHCH